MPNSRIFSYVVSGVATLGLIALSPVQAQAAQLSQASLRLDRMSASASTGGTVCLTLATTGSTDAKVLVTFPSGFTVNGTAGNWTVTTTNLPAGATAMPGVATATAVSGQTVTFPISNISTTDLHCFNFSGTSTLTNGSAGSDQVGQIAVTTSGDVEVDSGQYATSIIADDTVSVTATVPATFSLSLSGNSQSLGTLSSSAVTSGSGVDVEISTNAGNGWVAWLRSANKALNSVASGGSIPNTGAVNNAPSTLTPGVAGYVVDADLQAAGTGGTLSINAEYDGGSTSAGGDLSNTSFSPFASSNGASANQVVRLIPRVTISGLTPAATDYTDTLTIVAAGNF